MAKKSKDGLTVVRFLRGWGKYNRDDLAGFSDDVTAQLIAQKHAVEWDGKPVDKKPNKARADRDIAAQISALDARAAELDAREAAIAAAEKPVDDVAATKPAKGGDKAGDKAPGTPPTQGAGA